MTVASNSDNDSVRQARKPLAFHRRGSRALLISSVKGVRLDPTLSLTHLIASRFVEPRVTTICRRKEVTDHGQALLDEPAWAFSPCRRPVQHPDSATGVSLCVVTVDQQKYHVWSESQGENQALLLLSHEPRVYCYVTQFARIVWDTGRGFVEHFPDILVEMIDGRRVILDVRPRELWDTAFLAKAYLTQQWCASRGMTYGLVDRQPREVIALHRMADHYRDVDTPVWKTAAVVLDILHDKGSMAIRDVALYGSLATRECMKAVLFLVSYGRIRVDVWSQFHDTCFIEPTSEGPREFSILDVAHGLEIRRAKDDA